MNPRSAFISLLPVFAIFAIPFSAHGGDGAGAVNKPYHLDYKVSEQTVTIVTAITPYETDQKIRNTFLHWFKRGFETVLAGDVPFMIEWRDSAEGIAGQRGYGFGMDEAERYRKIKSTHPVLQTIRFGFDGVGNGSVEGSGIRDERDEEVESRP